MLSPGAMVEVTFRGRGAMFNVILQHLVTGKGREGEGKGLAAA